MGRRKDSRFLFCLRFAPLNDASSCRSHAYSVSIIEAKKNSYTYFPSSDNNVKDEQKILSLIESIQPAFELESQELITDMASVLVPAVRRVKRAHHRLGTSVDATFHSGMDKFDAGCQATDARAIKQHDEINTIYLASQVCSFLNSLVLLISG